MNDPFRCFLAQNEQHKRTRRVAHERTLIDGTLILEYMDMVPVKPLSTGGASYLDSWKTTQEMLGSKEKEFSGWLTCAGLNGKHKRAP